MYWHNFPPFADLLKTIFFDKCMFSKVWTIIQSVNMNTFVYDIALRRMTIVILYQIRTLYFFIETTSKEEYKKPFSSLCIIESWRACILSNLNSAKTIISNEDLELLCNLATLQVFYTMSLNVIDHRKRVKYFSDEKRYIGSRVSLVKIRRFNPSICLQYLGG